MMTKFLHGPLPKMEICFKYSRDGEQTKPAVVHLSLFQISQEKQAENNWMLQNSYQIPQFMAFIVKALQ